MNSFLKPPQVDPEYWRGKRVVVTGGSGFVGSHLVERLLPFSGQIVVPTRQEEVPCYLQTLADNVEILRGDLNEPEFAMRAIKGADIVLALAAVMGGIQYNMTRHASVFRDNMGVYIATIEAVRRAEVARLLACSSACVYPRHCEIPTPESEGMRECPEPTNEGYGWAKRMEEYLASAYAEEFGMSVAVARPYNAYGPRDNFDLNRSHVIPAIIRKTFDENLDEIVVWGSGNQSRSFLYVTDFVDGLIRVCERATDSLPVNVGADEETSVAQLVRLIVRLSGTDKSVKFDTSCPEGQPRRHCDVTKLERDYDFRARVSLEEGIHATINYFREEIRPCLLT